MRFAPCVLFGAAALAAPASSQSVQFSALIRAELGYGTNPFLRSGVSEGSGSASITFSPRLVYATPRSTTTLTGDFSRDQYLSRFGNTDSIGGAINRTDQLAQNLSSTLTASYVTTNKATSAYTTDDLIGDPTDPGDPANDPLNIGRRTNHASASYQLQWQASAADRLAYGGNVSHLSYGGSRATINGIASDYTQYGVNGSYTHVLDARTTVGAQASLTSVHSHLYPRSRAFQPSLTATEQLTPIWNLQGHVGLVLQRIYGPLGRSTTSLGYGATLCGIYPRTRFCFSAERGSAPSGYGGLRTNSSIQASLTRTLTEHSRLTFGADYDVSKSSAQLTALDINQGRVFRANADYDRDLSQRISAGIGGRYQWRDASRTGAAHAVAAMIHISAKIGRM